MSKFSSDRLSSYKARVHNKVADPLSGQADLLAVLCTEIVEFDCMKNMYHEDDNFKEL